MATTFPDGFVWGTATAAHQVEGNNWNNDWWAWEHAAGTPRVEPSGDARDHYPRVPAAPPAAPCAHYHRRPDDIRLLRDLGFNAYRFSLEWSRIEPESGEFSNVALEHYRRMCGACQELGLEPSVTLHHFTTPRGVAARAGGPGPAPGVLFARAVGRVPAHLGDVIGRACPFYEPNIVATFGYQ